MDTLGEIRVKMISHKTSLTLFLDTIQLHQSGKMSEKLNCQKDQLDVILDKVDNIAARMGHGEGSIMTNYEDDDRQVWKQFRRELVAEGFSSDVLQQHKDVLRAYIREIDQKGLLDEPRTPTPPGINPERWVDSVHSAASEDAPPSFSSLGTGTDDTGAKEMVVREENMKFPQSMKLELRQPEMHRNVVPDRSQPVPALLQEKTINETRLPPPLIPISAAPQLVPSDEKEVFFHTPDHYFDEDEDSDHETPSNGDIIQTSDLLALTQALQLRVPGSPSRSSFRSSMGSLHDGDPLRSMALRPKKQAEFGSSPLQPGAISIPGTAPSQSRSSFGAGTSPRPEMSQRLAPDEHGNEIPADAKWTRINRALVSPEVLQQDGRRYEARPDFVAVLGVLSRAEIENLAARSQTLRAARGRRSFPVQEKGNPPPQPPRPIPVPNISIPSGSIPRTRNGHGRDTSSSSSHSSDSSSSESDSDSGYDHGRRRRCGPQSGRHHTTHDNTTHGHPPTLTIPVWSPASSNSTAHQAYFMSGGLGPGDMSQPAGQPQSWSYNYNAVPPFQPQHRGSYQNGQTQPQVGHWPPPPNAPHPSQQAQQQYPVQTHQEREWERERERDRDSDRDKNKERKRRGERRRHTSSSSSSNRERGDRDGQRRQSRWKENLTAAGIGGAAASLLNVLTEAAEIL